MPQSTSLDTALARLREVMLNLPPRPRVNGPCNSLAAPAGLGLVAGASASVDIDLNGRSVRLHSVVSFHGLRGQVVEVSDGSACVRLLDAFGRYQGNVEIWPCRVIQVVEAGQ